MKKLYFLFILLISFVSFGQTTVFSESFETDGNGTRYASSVPEFTDGSGDFFIRTDGTGINTSYVVTGEDGSFYFAAMDTDGDGNPATITIDFDDIDISTFTNLTFAMLVAEDDDGTNEDWDDGSSFTVEVDIDNSGMFTTLLQFEAIELRPDGSSSSSNKEPALDTDNDGVGDGTRLAPNFQEFTAAMSSGSLVDIRLTFTDLKNGDEDIAIDNIRLIDGFVSNPTVSVTAPADGTVFAPGTSSVDVEFSATNLSGGETFDIDVNGSLFTGVTSPYPVPTVDGQSYNITVNLMSGATVLDFEGVDFSVGNLITVADITALRADVTNNGLGRFYEITNGSLVTHTDGFRDRKWIQDTNISGVLIYDQADVLNASPYAVGDMVTGLRGTTEESNGILRFVPTSDSGTLASSGNPVTPQVVTVPAFNAAPNDYESELIELQNVSFPIGDGMEMFATGQNYDINDGAENTIMRTDFFSADYIGTIIPMSTTTLPRVIGVAGEFNGTSQIYVRSLSDLILSTPSFETTGFKVYPNPTATGFVNIVSANNENIAVTVYDILGKQVISETVSNNRLNVSALNTGIYILKISQNNASVTKKLVIK
ncbi:MAG: T9SS type A sorting domain-containing protein [Psychroserpens sp.]|uniref:T9SS type A sorting domain-containing protein n=1 Tax=Psychroserpens sp. TaxID=2020870 RepID=UPI0030029347